MDNPSKYLSDLIREFAKLPGIGAKSASRFAFHILGMPLDEVKRLAAAIVNVRENISSCSVCGGISDGDICSICMSDSKNRELICVVESAKDMITIENTGRFGGVYHVLRGVISPLDGIGPSDLNIEQLARRIREGSVQEIILAFNSSIEGDATSLYLARLFRDTGIRVTRLAHGLPAGADLEYTDSATLIKSLEGRVAV